MDEERKGVLAWSSGTFGLGVGYPEGINYSYFWKLQEYRNSVKKEEQVEAWDELEKSVIASLADDVTVGIKGNHAQIVVEKKFA